MIIISPVYISIHRKEALSADADESGDLCGPGFKGCADQEVRLLSSMECLLIIFSRYTRHSFPPFPVNWAHT